MTLEQIEQFKNWQQPLPSREPHETPEEIRTHLTPLLPTRWTQQGDMLTGHVDGSTRFTQKIPTNYMLKTSVPDKEGKPQLTKLNA